MPTILKVANVHFTQTGNNRLEYTGNGVIRLTANGIQVPVGTTTQRPSGVAGIGVQVSFNGKIQSVTTLANRTGNCTIDIWKGPYAAYPLSNANTITASSLITLNNQTKNVDSTLSGWANTINVGDILQFNVVTNDNIEKISLMITAQSTL